MTPPCPKCGLAMESTNVVHTSIPAKYGYRCSACGTHAAFTQAELNAFPADPKRIHITEGSAFRVRDEHGHETFIGPGWLAITEVEYKGLRVQEGRLKLLADALLKVLIHDGMIRADVDGLTGPELLTAADTYIRTPTLSPEGLLEAGEVVPREDGRFYVPVSRVDAQEDVSNIVLRVASDAFGGDMYAAASFADEIVHRWNGKT